MDGSLTVRMSLFCFSASIISALYREKKKAYSQKATSNFSSHKMSLPSYGQVWRGRRLPLSGNVLFHGT